MYFQKNHLLVCFSFILEIDFYTVRQLQIPKMSLSLVNNYYFIINDQCSLILFCFMFLIYDSGNGEK